MCESEISVVRTCVRACVAAVRPGLNATPQKSAALHWVALGKQRDCTHCAVIAQPLQEKVKRGPSSPDQTLHFQREMKPFNFKLVKC